MLYTITCLRQLFMTVMIPVMGQNMQQPNSAVFRAANKSQAVLRNQGLHERMQACVAEIKVFTVATLICVSVSAHAVQCVVIVPSCQ